jgi:hypothetical protein
MGSGAPRIGFTRGGLYRIRQNRTDPRIKLGNNEIKTPTRRVYAWGLYRIRQNRTGPRIKLGNNEIKTPTRKPDAWGTQPKVTLTKYPERLTDSTWRIGGVGQALLPVLCTGYTQN